MQVKVAWDKKRRESDTYQKRDFNNILVNYTSKDEGKQKIVRVESSGK